MLMFGSLLEEMARALVKRKLIAGEALDALTARVVRDGNSHEGDEITKADQSDTPTTQQCDLPVCAAQTEAFSDASAPLGS